MGLNQIQGQLLAEGSEVEEVFLAVMYWLFLLGFDGFFPVLSWIFNAWDFIGI